MIRERLYEMDIKITELAEYLQITRPTLYKYIEYYDVGEKDGINKKILKLFDYIESNPLAGKRVVINYILSNLVEVKELGESMDNALYSKVKKYLMNNPNSNKKQFIEYIIARNDFDIVIDYLIKVKQLINKRKLSDEEIEFLKPYDVLIELIDKENL